MKGQTVSFSDAEIAGIAATYDPMLHEAPLVVGHPAHDDPAFGWVRSVSAEGTDLFAEPEQVAAAFAEAVEGGSYKKLSVALYLPESPAHPVRQAGGEPTAPYLKHVGFLGGMAPAIKGLRPVEFGEDEQGVAVLEFSEAEFADASTYAVRSLADLFRGIRNFFVETAGLEKAEAIIPEDRLNYLTEDLAREEGREIEREMHGHSHFAESPDSDPPVSPQSPPDMEKDPTDTTADFAERVAALMTREQQLAEREAKIKDAEAEAARAEHLAFAEGLADDGVRILPRHVPVVAAVLDSLAGVAKADTVAFGEGDDAEQLDAADALQKMLSELPQNVEFGEVAKATLVDEAGHTVEFASAPGFTVDAAQLDVHRKALAYQKDHEVSYVDAVLAVS